MTPLPLDVIRAALTSVTGLVPRHATMLPPASNDPADYEAPRDEDLPDHDPLDDAEGT